MSFFDVFSGAPYGSDFLILTKGIIKKVPKRVRVGVVPWFRRCARAGWRARDGLSRGGLRQRRVPCVGYAGDALSPRVRCQLEPLDLGAGRARRAACSDRAKALRGEVTW